MIDPTVSLFILLTVTVCCAMWARFLPKTLRGHAVAAIIWTAITGCQTFMLIIYRERPNPIGHLALLVSGWVMVSAWRQLAERRRGEHDRQSRRSLAARLFVQTLWGPLALGIALWGIATGADRLLDHALAWRNKATVSLLRAGGFRADNYWYSDRLAQLVERQDVAGVRFYLDTGVVPQDYVFRLAVHHGNVEITEMLLQNRVLLQNGVTNGEPWEITFVVPGLLRTAVEAHQRGQVRFLLNNGAEPNEKAESGSKSLLRLAERDGDTAMIALLKGAGAKR